MGLGGAEKGEVLKDALTSTKTGRAWVRKSDNNSQREASNSVITEAQLGDRKTVHCVNKGSSRALVKVSFVNSRIESQNAKARGPSADKEADMGCSHASHHSHSGLHGTQTTVCSTHIIIITERYLIFICVYVCAYV